MIKSTRSLSLILNPVLLLLLLISNKGLTQEFEWVKSTIISSPTPSSIVTDDAGNVYSVGRFVGMTDFDPGPEEHLLMAYESTGDIFICKMDTDGNFIWAKSIYGYGNDDQARSLDVSPDGNEIYVSGFFQDSADFDPGVDIYMLEMTGPTHDLFVLNLDGDGNFQWAQNIPADEAFHLESTILVDIDGSVLFTGVFTGTFDFDPDLGITETLFLDADAEYATFFQKLDTDGDLIWATRVSNIIGNDAYIDNELNLFLTGSFSGESDFDGGAGESLLDSEGLRSSFVLKIDSNGDFIWVEAFIGNEIGRGEHIQLDLEGNILCSGMYTGTIDADTGPAVYGLTSNGSLDHFFIKLDEFGNLIWGKSIGGEAIDWSNGIEVNSENEIYISGSFIGGDIDLDPGIDEAIVSNFGGRDFYILKLDEVGNLLWQKHSNGLGGESIIESTIDTEDNLYFIGQFGSTVDFDFCPTAEHELVYAGAGAPAYILKLSDCLVFGDTIVTGECESYTSPFGEIYTETGTYYEALEGSCNCDSLITFDVTIWNIDLGITQDGAEFTSLEADPEATYQWLNCEIDYSEIPSETDQVFYATEDGEYALVITLGPCVDTTSCIAINGVGIEHNQLEINALIYPNPNTGQFNIQLGKTYQTIEVIVRNIAGEIVMNSTHKSVKIIPMEIQQSKGIYFLEIKTNNGEQAFLKVVQQ